MSEHQKILVTSFGIRSVGCLPLRVEVVQFLENRFHFLDWGHEICDSEVVGARLLMEATARHGHDPRLVHHVHAVQEVRLDALRVGIVDKLLREVHAGESVHSTLDLRARHVLHVVERGGQ